MASQPEVVTTQTIVSTGLGLGSGRAGVFQITATLGPIEKRKNSALLTLDWRKVIFPMIQRVAPSGRPIGQRGGGPGAAAGPATPAFLSL